MKRPITASARLYVSMVFVLICSAGLAADAINVRPVVAVLEFHDYSRYQNHLIGRRVADALTAALVTTNRWETVDAATVRRASRSMNLKPPVAVGYQQALAHNVNADMTVTGRIEGVEIDSAQGIVKVVIIADFIDRIVGQSALPIKSTGTAKRDSSNPKPTDVIVEEAIVDACRSLAEVSNSIPRGIGEVTQVDRDDLTLRTEMNATLVTGDRMLLFRKRTSGVREYELVACIMVKKLDKTTVHAKTLGKTTDIYTGDIATCVGPARSGLE